MLILYLWNVEFIYGCYIEFILMCFVCVLSIYILSGICTLESVHYSHCPICAISSEKKSISHHWITFVSCPWISQVSGLFRRKDTGKIFPFPTEGKTQPSAPHKSNTDLLICRDVLKWNISYSISLITSVDAN